MIVEYDGQQHRLEDAQYEKDAGRLELFHLDDWHVIRVRKEGLFHFPTRTVSHVRAVLHHRGWVPNVPQPACRTGRGIDRP